MAIDEPFPSLTRIPKPAGGVAVLGQRERLAIVSTRNKLCGIAAYTHALERQLADLFEIEVFDLDQYLLHGKQKHVRALGDAHIKEICAELGKFDAVSLQLEFGTLGRRARDIEQRFRWLVDAAPRLSVTFHSLKRPPVFPIADFARALSRLDWHKVIDIKARHSDDMRLSLGVARILRRAQKLKPVGAIVHNHRDRADARYLHGFKRVFDHPLCFLSPSETDAVLSRTTRKHFALLDPLPADTKLIGVFGFLNNYKGFEVAIRALHHLPEDYHLLIFGGVHPNDIPAREPVHPYIASLLGDAHVDDNLYGQIQKTTAGGVTLDLERHLADLFGKHPRDLSSRVHFMGALSDPDFLAGMAICDVVVLPYLEVGQSASGPVSLAVELGCRVVASRTHTFLEFARYHPDTIEFFDIGNHLELAARIAARRQYAARRDRLRYTVETNRAVYLAANSDPAAPLPYRAAPPQPEAEAAQ